jgi:hypothetical protein
VSTSWIQETGDTLSYGLAVLPEYEVRRFLGVLTVHMVPYQPDKLVSLEPYYPAREC